MKIIPSFKPDAEDCLKRIYAWFHQEITDRVPVRFYHHNIEFESGEALDTSRRPNLEARHLDIILHELPGVQAIQWVQGIGADRPIIQWLPVRRIQNSGKSVIVDLQMDELSEFMDAIGPRGIFLCMDAPEGGEPAILRELLKWQDK